MALAMASGLFGFCCVSRDCGDEDDTMGSALPRDRRPGVGVETSARPPFPRLPTSPLCSATDHLDMDYLGKNSAPASDAITDGLITVNLRWLMKKLIERPKVYIVIHAPPADGTATDG